MEKILIIVNYLTLQEFLYLIALIGYLIIVFYMIKDIKKQLNP